MTEPFLEPAGIIVPATVLSNPRARELARIVGSGVLPYAKLIECRSTKEPPAAETVVLEVEVERGQVRVHDVDRIERVAAIFSDADISTPQVLSLRPDFPSVPHLNFSTTELPRSLCLYEQTWEFLKLRWTPSAFVERIRQWLSLTSAGKLHQPDQPLEPFLFASPYRLVLPSDLFASGSENAPEQLFVVFAGSRKDAKVLLALRQNESAQNHGGTSFVATIFQCKPQQHGLIRSAPRTLKALHDFLVPGGIDLLGELTARLRIWGKELRSSSLIIIVAFPQTRGATQVVEATDLWAFLTATSIEDVGKAIGCWAGNGKTIGFLLTADQVTTGESVGIDVLTPHFSLSPNTAAAFNGAAGADGRKIAAIGAGALGSQIQMNLARTGFGEWHIIDHDRLLPHNLARHELFAGVGFLKANLMALAMNTLFDAKEIAAPIIADVLHPMDEQAKLSAALAAADVILDMSASLPVARHLTHNVVARARRMSVFLNPKGSDLVLLAEDDKRQIPLDCLEMQYYRAIGNDEGLIDHLKRTDGRIRYAQSCRDVSSTIPQHFVGLHAAIASKAIRQAADSPDAAIRIWHADEETMAVTLHSVAPAKVLRLRIGDWTVCTDELFLKRIFSLRRKKLPNETGGVLMGSFETERKIVYIVDTIPSPPDSKEWPTLYIRGSQELPKRVEEMSERTGQNLEYVGEWHSHPKGYGCTPSRNDHLVFEWLIESMDADGLPALMLIAGDRGDFRFFLGRME